jgi:hypothetical protein
MLLLLAIALVAASCATDGGSASSSAAADGSDGALIDAGGGTGDQSAGTGALVPADTLSWTVLAVEPTDTLNVRADPDPDAEIVGALDPWVTDLHVGDLVDQNASGMWRSIELDDGTQGWVNARFLVAQPDVISADEQAELASSTLCFARWARGEAVDDDCDRSLADRGLWVAGIGIFADAPSAWNWIPATTLGDQAGWAEVRTFELGPNFGDFDCGADCDKSLVEFLDLGRIDGSTTPRFDDIAEENGRGFLDGALWLAPETLHRVVLDTPASEPDSVLDWQRLHVVHDWSTGEPRIIAINNHGWTP